MIAHFTDTHLIAAVRAAEQVAPLEACGLLVVRDGQLRMWPAGNVAANPRAHFEVDPVDIAAAEAWGEVVAVWHSHPDGSPTPSLADRVMCAQSGLPWLIVTPSGRHEWLAPAAFEAPLLDRPYIWGLFDCWELARDWYRLERGLQLARPDVGPDVFERSESPFITLAREYGFSFVAVDSPLEVGDLVIMQVQADVPNHCGVIDASGLLLHHAIKRPSEASVYGGFWRKVTTHRLRYAA